MTDLDAAIRAQLENAENMHSLGDPVEHTTFSLLVEVIEAVLDLHAAPERALPGEIHCGELIDWVDGGCPTVHVIAEKLGVDRG